VIEKGNFEKLEKEKIGKNKKIKREREECKALIGKRITYPLVPSK